MPDYRRILSQGRRWIAAAALLFFVGGLLGYLTGAMWPSQAMEALEAPLARLEQVGQQFLEAPTTADRAAIFFRNNGLAALQAILLGLFPVPFFGFWPGVMSFANGALVGLLLGLGRHNPDLPDTGTFLVATIPHGIVELPAIWVASAWGMKLGLAWLLPGANGRRLRVLGETALEAAQIFVLVSLLLIVAAVVEAGITYPLVQRLGVGLGSE